MTTEFAATIAGDKHAQQPLRFLAADFFVPYWRHVLAGEIDAASVRTAQEAARACVDLSMGGEAIYWNIDFSVANALRTWRLFDARTKGLAPEPLGHVQALCLQLLATPQESVSADALLSLVPRLRHDWSFRGTLGYPADDADVLGAAYEGPRTDFVSIPDLTERWLESETPWDLRLKSHTPDLPEFVVTIFGTAYGPRTALPLFRQNLRALLGTEDAYRAFVKRLQRTFERAQSPEVKVAFPVLLRV